MHPFDRMDPLDPCDQSSVAGRPAGRTTGRVGGAVVVCVVGCFGNDCGGAVGLARRAHTRAVVREEERDGTRRSTEPSRRGRPRRPTVSAGGEPKRTRRGVRCPRLASTTAGGAVCGSVLAPRRRLACGGQRKIAERAGDVTPLTLGRGRGLDDAVSTCVPRLAGRRNSLRSH
jgi:hypothetical protein